MPAATKVRAKRAGTLPSGNFVVDIRKEVDNETLRWRLSTRTKSSREHEKRASILRDLAQSREGRAILDRLKARSLSVEEVVGALSAGGKGMSALRHVSKAVTLGEALAHARGALKSRKARANTLKLLDRSGAMLLDTFGEAREVAKLSATELQKWLSASGAPSTQKTRKAYAQIIWKSAIQLDQERAARDHRLPQLLSNPWERVKGAKGSAPEVRFLTKEEVAEMLDRVEPRDPKGALFLACGFLGGMRLGEARTLAWEDVDFDEGTIRVREKKEWAPKTLASTRTLYAPARLLAALRAEEERSKSREVFGWCERTASRHALSAFKLAGLECGRGRGLTFHSGRHSAISNALRAGVPVVKVSRQFGVSVATLLKVYSHVLEGDAREVARALE